MNISNRRFQSCFVFVMAMFLFVSQAFSEQKNWDCPECGRKGNTGNYCGGCANPAPWIENNKEAFQKVGNIVIFGHYEQDNNLDNGKEEIEWIVLDVKDGKSFLLSKYLLDAKPYHESYEAVTWETCTLRKWLNGEFLEAAFSEKERGAIITTTVDNSASHGYSRYETDGGNNTQDKLFLLSCKEAFETYFNSYKERKGETTDYLIHKERWATRKSKVWWWLRSPGYDRGRALSVVDGNSLGDVSVGDDCGCVRPVFWINLESEIF